MCSHLLLPFFFILSLQGNTSANMTSVFKILCAQHQKRIVDDILTLSKLDSNLLVISPDRTSAPSLLEKTIKMYEAELVRSDVSARLILENTYTQLAVDEVMLDSSRLLQVVINLFTNALKFTQYSEHRELRIYLGASTTQPTCDRFGTAFIAARPNRPDHTSSPEWGKGEELYLQVRSLSDQHVSSVPLSNSMYR